MLNIDEAERATLRAALRHYLDDGLGEPANRTDEIHDLATDGGNQISLDESGVRELIEQLKTGCARPGELPQTNAQWQDLANQRGWTDAMLSHARDSFDAAYTSADESVIELPGDIALVVPVHPLPCDYVRVVDRAASPYTLELAYWSSDEWRDAPEEVIGAVMGLVKRFQPKLAMQLQQLRVPPLCYERTASKDEIALEIARIATGEDIVDPDAARDVVRQRFPRATWEHEVANDDTDQGYWEWALHEAQIEREQARDEDESSLYERATA